MSTKRTGVIGALGMAFVLAAAGLAQAGSITFNDETFDGGTGFGNVLSITTLHDTGAGSDNQESGGVVDYTGGGDTSGDVYGGDDTVEGAPHTLTRSVQEIIDLGWVSGQDVGIVFNLSETGSEQTVQLFQFIVYGWDEDGNLLRTWTFDADDATNGDTFDEASQGGGNSGFLFRLGATDDGGVNTLASFMATGTNRFGLFVQDAMLQNITNVDGGNETFYITNVDPRFVSEIPLPPAALLGLGLMGGLGAFRMRRRRQLSEI